MHDEPPIVDFEEVLSEGGADEPIRTTGQWVVLGVISALAVLGITMVLLFVVPPVAGFLTDLVRFVAQAR